MAKTLNFHQIAAFRAVMQKGTTTRAADMLNTTQPSVSRRIAELESSIKLKLFDLQHGRLRPTDEGRALYRTVEKHFQGLEKIESVAAALRMSGTGVLRIGCTSSLAIGIVPDAVHEFLKQFPGTFLNIQTFGTQQLTEYLNQGLFDLVLTTGTLDHKDFQPTTITTTGAICVLPLGHRLGATGLVDITDIRGERIITLSNTDDLTLKIKAYLTQHGITQNQTIETSSSITACALVASGNGIGIVTPYVVNMFTERLLVRELRPYIPVPIQAILSNQPAPSMLTKHFLDVLTRQLGTALT